MTPEVLNQLRARMKTQPRSLEDLHQAATAAGSAWTADQVHLLLACLPDVREDEGLFDLEDRATTDPLIEALTAAVGDQPIPAAALVARLPRGLAVTAAGLVEAARRHPQLFDIVPPNRIRRRA